MKVKWDDPEAINIRDHIAHTMSIWGSTAERDLKGSVTLWLGAT